MTDQLDQPLRTVVEFLEYNGYRYAVIGGIALAYWGVVRTTYDVDIKVLTPDFDYSAMRASLRSAFPSAARQMTPENPLIVSVLVQDVIVDFLLALPGYEEMIVERAEIGNLGEFPARICSAEDLIIQKVVAGRGKDWPDVEALLMIHGDDIDAAYVEEIITQFALALDNPRMLDEYLAIVRKTRQIT